MLISSLKLCIWLLPNLLWALGYFSVAPFEHRKHWSSWGLGRTQMATRFSTASYQNQASQNVLKLAAWSTAALSRRKASCLLPWLGMHNWLRGKQEKNTCSHSQCYERVFCFFNQKKKKELWRILNFLVTKTRNIKSILAGRERAFHGLTTSCSSQILQLCVPANLRLPPPSSSKGVDRSKWDSISGYACLSLHTVCDM